MKVADLFAGAGGFSAGAHMAGCNVVWAGNHWPVAVETHARNHPHAQHVCQDLQQADWSLVPRCDTLLASPACQGHTRARGKERAHHDATRATAWAVVSALEVLEPGQAVVENVVEFLKWTLFPAWCAAVTALGYAIAPHVIDAADHGVPQHRRRMFLVLTRSKHPLQLKLDPRAHVSIDSVLEWDAGDWSLIDRPGRSAATLARVAAGRKAFGSRFLAPFYGSGSGLTGRSIERPLGTLTTRDRWAVVDGDRMRMLSITEARRVMGFPDSYLLPPNGRVAMHMLGNAVCPPVARDILNALKEAA